MFVRVISYRLPACRPVAPDPAFTAPFSRGAGLKKNVGPEKYVTYLSPRASSIAAVTPPPRAFRPKRKAFPCARIAAPGSNSRVCERCNPVAIASAAPPDFAAQPHAAPAPRKPPCRACFLCVAAWYPARHAHRYPRADIISKRHSAQEVFPGIPNWLAGSQRRRNHRDSRGATDGPCGIVCLVSVSQHAIRKRRLDGPAHDVRSD